MGLGEGRLSGERLRSPPSFDEDGMRYSGTRGGKIKAVKCAVSDDVSSSGAGRAALIKGPARMSCGSYGTGGCHSRTFPSREVLRKHSGPEGTSAVCAVRTPILKALTPAMSVRRRGSLSVAAAQCRVQ